MKQPLSLKGRALALLAQREQSALELRRKLLRHARAEAAANAAAAATGAGIDARAERADRTQRTVGAERTDRTQRTDGTERTDRAEQTEQIAERVDAVIAWLRENDYLNEDRFVETRVHARASRFGSLRIQRELAEHGLSLSGDEARSLRATEPARAADVWQRKFGRAPVDRAEQGRQMRFLVSRGFAPDIVRALVRLGRSDAVGDVPDEARDEAQDDEVEAD